MWILFLDFSYCCVGSSRQPLQVVTRLIHGQAKTISNHYVYYVGKEIFKITCTIYVRCTSARDSRGKPEARGFCGGTDLERIAQWRLARPLSIFFSSQKCTSYFDSFTYRCSRVRLRSEYFFSLCWLSWYLHRTSKSACEPRRPQRESWCYSQPLYNRTEAAGSLQEFSWSIGFDW